MDDLTFVLNPRAPKEPLTATLGARPNRPTLSVVLEKRGDGSVALTREALLELLGQLSEEEREALGIPKTVPPDPVDREEVLELLANLSPEEREGLGIPAAGVPNRPVLISEIGTLSDDEQAQMVGLVRLGDVPFAGLAFQSNIPLSHTPARYIGAKFNSEIVFDRVQIPLNAPNVQGGEIIRVVRAEPDFGFGFVIAEATLEPGQFNVNIDGYFEFLYAALMVGTDNGNPDIFLDRDAPYSDGSLEPWANDGLGDELGGSPFVVSDVARIFYLQRQPKNAEVTGLLAGTSIDRETLVQNLEGMTPEQRARLGI